MPRKITFLIVLIALLAASLAGLTGCAAQSKSADGMDMSKLKMAPAADLPADVRQSSVTVQEAYRFAVANPDVMKQIPCYCGCGAMGHTSNYACYVKSDAGGKIVYEPHALGCSICVDITRDTMKMLSQGKSVAQIKAAIDQTYSQYGPSNIK